MSFKYFTRSLAAGLTLAALTVPVSNVLAQQGNRYPTNPAYQQQIPVANPIAPTGGAYGPQGQMTGGAVYGDPNIPTAQAIGSGVPTGGQVARTGYRNEVPARQNQTRRNPAAQPGERVRYAYEGVSPQPQYATPSGSGGRVVPAGYVPKHMRSRQMIADAPLNQGPAPMQDPGAMPMNPGLPGEMMYEDPSIAIGESYVEQGGDCGCGTGDLCDSGCMIGCDRGGCPPGIIDECWLSGLGALLYRADYFAGAQSWDSPTFRNSAASDYNGGAGFYAGTNLGIPLCRLTCGLLSGQAGVRAVQSEINGDPNISQLFATAGLFRRVDYGLQFGVVLDYLREDVLFESEVMQIRGDLSWQYAGGNAFGFRFARGIQDDQVPDIIPGAGAAQFRLETLDNYRFYYRTNCIAGGYSDVFLGWSDESHLVGGLDLDIPVTERVALNAGATWLLPTTNPANVLGGNSEDAWNIFVGFAFRPQGRCYYDNYDRPILPVADNGSMVLRRGL